MDARQVAADYASLGFDPFPLRAGSKRPVLRGWALLPAPLQWADVHGDRANIGLRAGSGIAFLDFDDTAAWENGRRWLAGLGYLPDGEYPLVATPSGGRHVYASFRGGLPGDWRRLAPDFGKGELRYGPASYVAAPPSEIAGRQYELIAGDLRQLPKLDAGDVLPILGNQDTGEPDPAAAILATAPGDSPGRVGRKAWALLRGEGCERFPSRSEAEAAILAGLVDAGLSFGVVLGLFLRHPAAGKFAELHSEDPSKAIGYLRRSYDAVQQWTAEHATAGRKLAFLAVKWAQTQPWPGRTGRTDHAAFLAHGLTAYQVGREVYQLGIRELAERAGIGLETASRANRRLLDRGLIERVKANVVDKAGMYRVSVKIGTLPHIPDCEGVYGFCHFGDALPPSAHDAFRFRGLGKSAAELWSWLRAAPAPMTAAELAERSGRNLRTVYRVLGKLARIIDPDTGEVFRLAERGDGDTWRAVDANLDAIARAVGTAGAGERQRAEHEDERRQYREAIRRAREGSTPKSEVTGSERADMGRAHRLIDTLREGAR